MKTGIISLAIFILVSNPLAAQIHQDSLIKNLQQKVNKLERANKALRQDLENQQSEFKQNITGIKDSITTLSRALNTTKGSIEIISNDLGLKISSTETSTNARIETLDNTITKNTLYWIIGALGVVIISVILFILLRKQLSKEKLDLTANILQTKHALEEEGIKLDSKLIDLLGTQLQLVKEERHKLSSPSPQGEAINHELALKVADEIIRIQKNLANMDANTKGIKQLASSVKRIQDNFESNGYELVDMLNKPYDQGMKVSANFRPNEHLKPGEQIISRIIKPQVNFKGVMIQAAQIEVSIGD